MKNNALSRKLFLISFLFGMTGCQDYVHQVGEDMYNKEEQGMQISLNDAYREFDENAHFVTAHFEGNFWWNAHVELLNEEGDFETENWFRMTPMSNYGNREVTIEITRNIEKDHDRAVEITFTSDDGEFSHTLTVLQKACRPFIETSDASKSFSILGGTFRMSLSTSETWDIEGLPTWVSVTSHAQTTANPKGKEIAVEFTIAEYGGEESDLERDCEIVFTSADGTSTAAPQTLALTQSRTAKGPQDVKVTQTAVDLIADWDAPAGALYYDVAAYDMQGNKIAEKRFTPVAGEDEQRYSCSIDDLDWDGYIGEIDVTVKAYLSDNVWRESAKGMAVDHNYFAKGSGDGSSDADGSVMKVATVRHLENIQKCLNTGEFLYYKQTADIDLAYYTDNTYTPVGNAAKPFIGSYDGNGFAFRNLKCDKAGNYKDTGIMYGVFGVVLSQGSPVTAIRNVKVDNFIIKIVDNDTGAALNDNGDYVAVGNLAGMVKGGVLIEDCTVSAAAGYLSGSGHVSRTFFGGFVGVCDNAHIKNCTITGVKSFQFLNAPASVGGIVGTSTSDDTVIENCVNNVQYFNFSGNTLSFGGIMARGTGTIKKCANFTTMRSAHYTGGILAHSQYYKSGGTMATGTITIEDCVNYGDAKEVPGYTGALNYTSKNGAFGGIAGNITTPGSACYITRCANFGNVVNYIYDRSTSEGTDGGFYIGGIVGYGQQVHLTDCVNHGSITGEARGKVSTRTFRIGGIFGLMTTVNGKTERCYTTGTIAFTTNDAALNYVYNGGLCGFFNPANPITDNTLGRSYYLDTSVTKMVGNGDDRDIQATTSGAKTEAQLKDPATYNDWTDKSVWTMNGTDYPTLNGIHPRD